MATSEDTASSSGANITTPSTPSSRSTQQQQREQNSSSHNQLTPQQQQALSSPSPSAPLKEYLYKILVVGDLGTGKTSIIKRYVHNIFSMHYKSTIGVDFALKVLHHNPNTIVRLQLWDIAGQERFGNMTRVYYKEAVGALVVFDVTRISTFDGVSKWKADLDEKVRLPDGSPIPIVLLANKVDLGKDAMVKNASQMDKFCQEKDFIGWFETSAKENTNVDTACRFLVDKILENDHLNSQRQKEQRGRSQIIRPGRTEELDNRGPGGGRCCG